MKTPDIVLGKRSEFPGSGELLDIIKKNRAVAIDVTGIQDLETINADRLPAAEWFQEGNAYVIVYKPRLGGINRQIGRNIRDIPNSLVPIFWINDSLDLRFKEVITARSHIIIYRIVFEPDAMVVESVHEPPDQVRIWYGYVVEMMRKSFKIDRAKNIAAQNYMRELAARC